MLRKYAFAVDSLSVLVAGSGPWISYIEQNPLLIPPVEAGGFVSIHQTPHGSTFKWHITRVLKYYPRHRMRTLVPEFQKRSISISEV